MADFDYDLPDEAIAQHPVEPRDAARLLVDRGSAVPPTTAPWLTSRRCSSPATCWW